MKITVVTPSYQQCRFLRLTIESVLSQSGDFELEMLVIDGGSTDGSVELLRSIQDPRLVWISEPDRGQTDALRKGLAKATGDIIGWINSDDLYTPGALAVVAKAFARNPDRQWSVGRCQIIDSSGREIHQWISRYKDRRLRAYSFPRLLRENFICQMSVFWRRLFGQQIGEPDITLHYAMDYDLWLRMAKLEPPLILDHVLSQFRRHQSSKTNRVVRAQFREQYDVARRYAGSHRGSLLMNRLHAETAMAVYWLHGVLGLSDT
jgi:glycosyltransferase involved in cell wall biosynthesis